MSSQDLVASARAGDRAAFTRLVELYSSMAFGVAVSILGDYHLAEDATQEAFVAAYFGLHGLRDDAAFPSWVRRIVRNQCFRALRGRPQAVVPLDGALLLPEAVPGPDEVAAGTETRDAVLRAVMALPPELREVVTLYYMGDLSQREVAAFLDLPATTVNNRLYAARQRLKGGLADMVKDDLRSHGLNDDFPERVGRIIEARGPVIEAQFADDHVPWPLDEMSLDGATLAVVERLDGGRVRCVPLDSTPSLNAGNALRGTGRMIERPINADVLRSAIGVLLQGYEPGRAVLETGIKAIDLLCPIPQAGTIGLYGPRGAGKIVILGELLYRLRSDDHPLALLNFTQTENLAKLISDDESLPVGAGRLQAVYLPVVDAASPTSTAVEHVRDSMQGAIYLSRSMALQSLYPAIDPVVTWSSLLTADIVGPDHIQIAHAVRDLLQTSPDSPRARRLQLFLTQPFFTTERYTHLPGEHVSLPDTLSGCTAILSGALDHFPEDTFYFTGTLTQVKAKARQ